MQKIFFLLILIVGPIGCDIKDNKRDVYLQCEGRIVYQVAFNTIEVSSSFYIGEDFVEQEGTKYAICEEGKTKIKYSDDCKKTQSTEGDIDLIAKTVRVDNSLKKGLASMETYHCEIVKNPRY